METLCFTGNYTRRFARVKEFSNERVEVVLDKFLRQFCNLWLEEETCTSEVQVFFITMGGEM